MVIANVSMETTRFDLKSLPGAWVELKPMPHGQMLTRQENAFKQMVKEGSNKTAEMTVSIAQRATQIYEFKHCIVDHNLEELVAARKPDEDPIVKPFDFKKDETAIDRLHPKVGAEIGKLIDNMNQFDDGDADGSGN